MQTKINETYAYCVQFCQQHADPKIIEKYTRFFADGYDAWGIDQKTMEAFKVELQANLAADWSPEECMQLGDLLSASGKYEESIMAMWLLMKFQKAYTPVMFHKAGEWLETCYTNWAQVDVMCGEILSVMLIKKVVQPADVSPWALSASKWQRRAVPVSFIKPLKKGFDLQIFLNLIEGLLPDKEKPVQQGCGWFLRECWKLHPAATEAWLLPRKDLCGSILLQYATEKMTPEQKAPFRKRKPKA
jgi:3-methyladenine DNA glycosylase AlkD